MSGQADSNLTFLQRKILHSSAANPDSNRSDIADSLGCSSSYVGDVQRQHDEEIETIGTFGTAEYLISFAHPYSILLPDSWLQEFHLSVGDAMELTFDIDGEQRTTYGRVREFEDGMLGRSSAEMQARTFGCYQTAEALADRYGDPFDQFSTIDGKADLSTNTKFRTFLQTVQDELADQIDGGVDLLIGIGILEILHGERDPNDLVSAPQFNLERDHFVEHVTGHGPELVDGHLYFGSISEPDEVYFTYYGEIMNTDQLERLRRRILEFELFSSAWNYSLPGYRGVVGPTTTNPTDDVVRVTDESLHIVEGTRRNVQYRPGKGETDPDRLDVDNIHEAILAANPEFESLTTNTRYTGKAGEIPLRKSGDDIYFLFDQVTIVLTAHGDHISWLSPTEIKPVEKIIEAINHIIGDQLGWANPEMSTAHQHQPQRIGQSGWTFDTNALYHDHNGNRPTSILHTIFSQRFFHESTIHIPWAVLFEMNKHPESGSASEAPNKQGYENLAILRTLEQLEYLSVTVQTPPPEIEIDLSNGDIADMQILAYADDQESQLVSGDQSLVGVAQLSDTSSVDVKHLDSLSVSSEDDSGIENVLLRIGTDLHTETDIFDALADRIDKSATIPEAESSAPSQADPEEILKRSRAEGEILPYVRIEDGELCYGSCEEITIVPTKSVLERLDMFLDDDEEYLTDEFLTQITAGLHSLHDTEIPAITLLVPSEYIVEKAVSDPAPSSFNQGLFKIMGAKNVEYTSIPAINQDMRVQSLRPSIGDETADKQRLLSWDDYLAVCCAANHDSAKLLVTNTEASLWKFSKLLGLDAVSIDLPSDDEA